MTLEETLKKLEQDLLALVGAHCQAQDTRIKELEEALEHVIDLAESGWDDHEDELIEPRAVLNKAQETNNE